MKSLEKMLFDKPSDTGGRIGFVAILLITIAFIFPSFYNLGDASLQVRQFQDMMQTGLLMTIVFAFLYNRRTRTKRNRVGLSPSEIANQTKVVMIGISAGIALVVINAITNMGGNWLLGSTIGGVPVEAVYLGLLAGVAEELFFRGFIQTALRIFVPSVIFAVIPGALIFALFHYFAYQNPSAFVVIFLLGIFLGFLYETYNDIGISMIAHVVNNVFSMLPLVITMVTGSVVVFVLLVGVVVMSYLLALRARQKRRK